MEKKLTLMFAFMSNLYIPQVMCIIHDKITHDTCTLALLQAPGDGSDMSSL